MNCLAAKQHMARCKKCQANRRYFSPSQVPFHLMRPFPTMQYMERLIVRAALRYTGHNVTAAAELLGLSREGLRKMMLRLP